MTGEEELIRDVEEEVRRLLSERKMEHAKKPVLSIYYFRSPNEVHEGDLMAALKGGVVLIALKENSPESAKKLLEEMSKVVKQAGGAIYLIRSPSILVIGESARLEVQG